MNQVVSRFVQILAMFCCLLFVGCNDDKLLSRGAIARLYCKTHPRECSAFITTPTRTSGSPIVPAPPSTAVSDTTDNDRAFMSNKWFFLSVIAIFEANPHDPTTEQRRDMTQPVPLTIAGLDSGLTTNRQRLTFTVFSAIRLLDTQTELYARARHAVCTDRQGKRYAFTELPSQREVENGLVCRLPNDSTPLVRSINLLHFPTDRLAADGITENQRQDTAFQNRQCYPAECGVLGDASLPDPAACRNLCVR